MATISFPIKITPGVIMRRLSGSSFSDQRGLEFKHVSISTRIVTISQSKCKIWPSNNRTRLYFVDFTVASHNPPWCGAPSGLKCELMRFPAICIIVISTQPRFQMYFQLVICSYEIGPIVTIHIGARASTRDESIQCC